MIIIIQKIIIIHNNEDYDNYNYNINDENNNDPTFDKYTDTFIIIIIIMIRGVRIRASEGRTEILLPTGNVHMLWGR